MPQHSVSLRDFPIFGNDHDTRSVLALLDRYRHYSFQPPEFLKIEHGRAAGAQLVIFSDTGAVIVPSARGYKGIERIGAIAIEPGRYRFPDHATVRQYETPIVVMGGKGVGNFFHWMIEVVPRLQLVKARFGNSMPVIVRPLQHAFQRESLDILGMPVEEVSEDVVTAPEIWFPSHLVQRTHRGWLSPELVGLAQNFASLVPDEKRPAQRMYISRADAPSRRLVNEDAVMEMLAPCGFRLVRLADLSLREQLQMFRSAEAVIGPHGAGLVWTLYCRPGTKVIEIFPAGLPAVSMFWSIAGLVGLDYAMCVGTGSHAGLEMHVDLTALRSALENRNILPGNVGNTTVRKDLVNRIWRGADPFSGFPFNPAHVDKQGWHSEHRYLTEAIDQIRPQVIIEIGVWKGGSVLTMARRMKELGLDGVIIAVDTWLGAEEHWRHKDNFPSLALEHGRPQLQRTFMANIVSENLESYVLPLPLDSRNAALLLSKMGVVADVIHLDAAHDYESVKADLDSWLPLLKPDGLLIGDDYGSKNWPGVQRAFDERFPGGIENRRKKCRLRPHLRAAISAA